MPDEYVTDEMGADDEDDCVGSVAGGSGKVLQYEYHVLYSCSYGTPVLYFRVFTLGQYEFMQLFTVSVSLYMTNV